MAYAAPGSQIEVRVLVFRNSGLLKIEESGWYGHAMTKNVNNSLPPQMNHHFGVHTGGW